MTDKDRLIELIQSKTQPWEYLLCKANIEALADYLLANGVIVPPCNVGDTLYYPWVYDGISGIAILEVSMVHFYRQGISLVFYDDVQSDMPMPSAFLFDDFGKTVFLTKEEAEAKLKELKDNG